MLKVRIKFAKHGVMKFIGHLDVMRYFQKALRRAEIEVKFSEGMSPHMIMSFAAPLGVGTKHSCLYRRGCQTIKWRYGGGDGNPGLSPG